jgi:CBS domain-containing membrane protein
MEDPGTDLRLSVGNMGLTDGDIYEAMKAIPGYLDITPGDFRELYCHAYRKALERIASSVSARDMMTREVVFVEPEAPLAEVAKLMGRLGISGLPVVDEHKRVVGVISEKDFLSRMGEPSPKNFMTVVANCLRAKGCIALPIRAKKAKDIMSTPGVSVSEDAPFSTIREEMAQRSINRVPVIDSQGRIVGIITRNDLIAATLRSGACSGITSAK